MIDLSFQLKGSAITVVVLALIKYEPALFRQQLKEKIDQAPQFFVNSPILINLEKLDNPSSMDDFSSLLGLCRDLGLQPLGFTAVPDVLIEAARATTLAILPRSGDRALKTSELVASVSPAPARKDISGTEPTIERRVQIETVIEERLVQRVSKVITRPVRSGQQIYAEGADLIVLSQVSEGAEVLADGHIHIYGALRGRALAGVRGDDGARIFCQSMEAELVSVAGNFLLPDSFASDILKKSVQIYLSGENILVEKLVS